MARMARREARSYVLLPKYPFVLPLRSQSVTVPVFIQPDSEQPCLLGMNSLLPLGVQVVDEDGKPLLKLRQSKAEEKMLKVNLVSALTLPCQKGRIVEAKLIDCDVKHNMLDKKDVLFEPNREALSLLGLELSESLVTVYENKVLLPIENPQGIPVRLDECFELGTVKLVDLSATKGEQSTVESCQTSSNGHVKVLTPTVERAKKLLNVLSLPSDKLSPSRNR